MHIIDVRPKLPEPALIRRAALAMPAVLIGAVLMLAAAVPAEAHDTCSHHRKDPSVVCLKVDHSRIDVCDRHRDRHRAYARVRFGNGWVLDFYDLNGAKPGCERYDPYKDHLIRVPRNVPMLSYNVCVIRERCGRPRYRPGSGFFPIW